MAGFVAGVQELVDGEWVIYVETDAASTGCPACGVMAQSHGRRRVAVRDLPVAGRPVVLLWSKRIWRCIDPDCERKTWSETSGAIAPRAVLTERARAEMCRRVGAEEDSVAALAREFGVSWAAAMAAVRHYGTPLVDDAARLAGVTALGVDETTFLHARPGRRTVSVTGFVDLDRARLLDVVLGRSGAAAGKWLVERDGQWRESISVAALDAFRGYNTALVANLPNATVVMDHFHAVALANRALDKVRRRVQNDTLGHRGRVGDPLYRIRRIALVGAERLDDRGWQRLIAGLEAGDPDGDVAAAWLAVQLFRKVYAAANKQAASRALNRFYRHCDERDVPELRTLARTVRSWHHEILAYHATGASNGPTEAVNLLIEKVRRIGHGFRNFDNYRLRLILRCGVIWHYQPAHRIRDLKPRLIA
ncbi:MAG TPA: ISL3 family transposase [Acidimicrobiales bacterium]|jgi:transposase|nr:ISL3 family transposase [Acidimicrobiales bacterium]